MSVARGRGQNGGHFYSNITQPFECDLNFTVDSTNGNGLGVRSIKSNGYVENVFMHTTATPGIGNGGHVNPNPAVGYAVVQFKNNFNYYIGGFNGWISPPFSTTLTSVTAGAAYFITSLGTATTAQWQALGLIQGLTPTVGQAFIAASSTTVPGGATVGLPAPVQMGLISVVGDPNTTIYNSSIAQNGGAYMILEFAAPTSSSVTTPAATAPGNGTVASMTFKFDCSSVSIPDGGPSNSGTSGGL